jgi:bifunctional DNA-binding transcriptional regulator/antitoxin component of YhaV-PrlF toxin-antitoxin module
MMSKPAASAASMRRNRELTIPKPMRDTPGIAAGERVEFVDTGKGFLIVAVERASKSPCGALKGRHRRPATVDEINETLAGMGSRR